MIDEVCHEKIWLKSGGFLVIQQTEAFVSIDVNSGNNTKKKKKDDYYLSNNMEAAKEIARQVRLRNISGIIVVDFINLKNKEQKDALTTYMKSLLKEDYVKANVVDFTRLDLMEITRAKKYQSSQQALSYCTQ